MGFGMGFLFSSMDNIQLEEKYSNLSTKDQLRASWRHMKSRSWGMAKSFGAIGTVYSAIECGTEKVINARQWDLPHT